MNIGFIDYYSPFKDETNFKIDPSLSREENCEGFKSASVRYSRLYGKDSELTMIREAMVIFSNPQKYQEYRKEYVTFKLEAYIDGAKLEDNNMPKNRYFQLITKATSAGINETEVIALLESLNIKVVARNKPGIEKEECERAKYNKEEKVKDSTKVFKETGLRVERHSTNKQKNRKTIFKKLIEKIKKFHVSTGGIKLDLQPDKRNKYERISTTLFSKDVVRVNEPVFIQVFVHESDKAPEAFSMAKEFDKSTTRRQTAVLDGIIDFNSLLLFELEIKDLEIDEPIQYLTWHGVTNSVQFIVQIPPSYNKSVLIGKIKVLRNDMPIGHLCFKIDIVDTSFPDNTASSEAKKVKLTEYKHAFISYSSKDRDEVLKRVQMLELLRISYFQDIINLKAGDCWSDAIYRQIDIADIFLLFWSSSARDSEWVMKEVNYAIKKKGENMENPPEIYPVIIEGPPIIEPPKSLKQIHFNDKIALLIQSLKNPNSIGI